MHPTRDFGRNSGHLPCLGSRPGNQDRAPGAEMMSEDAKFALGY
jgi:hypothetical protein